ncbi:hypothetical protein BKA56DRAFT_434237, partial [Ilyonectria sp. MPI-CAGE-AT-0026]
IGTVRAAECAATVAQQFPDIRFALMIGIGGGIPSRKFDIRLGDIAVSIPRDGHPGVIEYDYGKHERDGKFVLKGSLDKPPPILISADGSLEEDEEMDESPLSAILEGITNKPRYARPKSDDVLFEPTFHHVNEGDDCSGCEASSEKKIMPRKAREEEIKVHRGLILSGSAVVRNPDDRARLCRNNETAICFEMEAAGIMDTIPCLVVRGICDYADTHKNDDWHRYAAATAAAYGKAILTKVHMSELEQTRRMGAILENAEHILIVEQRLKEVGNDRSDILRWLTPVNWISQHYIHSQKREPDSGQWFLNSPMFKQWLQAASGTLLCHGFPGAGKTIMTSVIIDYLESEICNISTQTPNANSVVIFLYCDFQQTAQFTSVHILEILLKHFLLARFHMDSVMEMASPNGTLATIETLPKREAAYQEIYAKTIQRISGQSEEYQFIARRILEWVVCALRPLTIMELREALSIKLGASQLDEGDFYSTEIMVEACKGLVTIEGAIVHLLHHTAREYLDSNFCLLWQLSNQAIPVMPEIANTMGNKIARDAAHQHITLACITYLSFSIFESGPCLERSELDQRHRSNKFYNYASCYWGRHLQCSGPHISGIVAGQNMTSFVRSIPNVTASYQQLLDHHPRRLNILLPSDSQIWTTPLHLAAFFGYCSVVKLLLGKNADIEATDDSGGTALSVTAQRGHVAVVQLLL